VTELADLAKGVAGQIGQLMRADLESDWDVLSDADRAEVEIVLQDWASLALRAQAGQDVTRELVHTKAAVLSWKFVGSSKVQAAFRDALRECAVFAGKVFLGLVV